MKSRITLSLSRFDIEFICTMIDVMRNAYKSDDVATFSRILAFSSAKELENKINEAMCDPTDYIRISSTQAKIFSHLLGLYGDDHGNPQLSNALKKWIDDQIKEAEARV
jgi:hypothetical protein